MSAAIRLAKLEATLSPKQATLLWLADAHQFPTLAAYVAWLVTQPVEAAPFCRVPEQAERAVRASMRGHPRDVVEAAAHQAVRDAVFLVELVIRLNVDAAELVRTETLRAVALAWEGRGIEAATKAQDRTTARRWTAWSDVVSGWTRDLGVTEQARHRLEVRYLDGRDALLPGVAAAWGSLVEVAGRPATLGDTTVPAGGSPRRRPRRSVGLFGSVRAEAREGPAGYAMDVVSAARTAARGLLGNLPTR